MGNVHLKWAFSEAAVTFLRWRGSRRNVTGDAAYDTVAFYDAAGRGRGRSTHQDGKGISTRAAVERSRSHDHDDEDDQGAVPLRLNPMPGETVVTIVTPAGRAATCQLRSGSLIESPRRARAALGAELPGRRWQRCSGGSGRRALQLRVESAPDAPGRLRHARAAPSPPHRASASYRWPDTPRPSRPRRSGR